MPKKIHPHKVKISSSREILHRSCYRHIFGLVNLFVVDLGRPIGRFLDSDCWSISLIAADVASDRLSTSRDHFYIFCCDTVPCKLMLMVDADFFFNITDFANRITNFIQVGISYFQRQIFVLKRCFLSYTLDLVVKIFQKTRYIITNTRAPAV